MERKMTAELLAWKATPRRKAFFLMGQRCVGKTYVIESFAKRNYRHYLRLDFREHPELSGIFTGDINASSLHRRLLAGFPGFRIEKGQSLLFLDGIHLCPDARAAIKPLVREGSLDVAAACSSLSLPPVPEGRLSPIGYEWIYRMHPMDFEEYLWALGVGKDATASIRDHIAKREPFDDATLGSLNRYLMQYVVVGGMPDAVLASMNPTEDRDEFRVQRTILLEYANDVSELCPPEIGNRVKGALDSVPGRLCQTNKRFRFTDAEGKENVGWREYADPVSWLESSGIVSICRNVSEPVRPLPSRTGPCFKMYMCDSGLLLESLGGGTRAAFFRGDHGINNGGIIENAVANMIERCGLGLFYFLRDRKREDGSRDSIEIDFIVDSEGPLTAVEVKSGNKRRSPSLNKLMTDEKYRCYEIGRYIKLGMHNIYTDERGVEHYPLFAAAFMDSMFERTEYRFVKDLELNL